jgi:DNA-binding NarL/FixJ family response regulator
VFTHIAVADPVGLQEAGAADNISEIVFLTLNSERDWERLEDYRLQGDRLIVAVPEEMDQTSCVRAMAAGAVSIVPPSAPVAQALHLVDCLSRGESVVPVWLVRVLAHPSSPSADDLVSETMPSSKELSWLKQLSKGVTVRELATSAGYSERMMFRALRRIYEGMQVGTRTEALFLAHERGWI